MRWLHQLPRSVRWTVPLGLIGLALTVPFSASDGTGMQWDELVLGGVAASSAWAALGIARTMDRTAGRPWRIAGYASALFATAQWLAAAFPGPALDGFGFDDVLLFAGACSPVVICALLARRVLRTRWPALVVDGLVVTVALLVVTEVLRTPLVNPADAPEDLRTLVLVYGAYAAVMLGLAGALCTVSTAALRRSVTLMLGAVIWQATAAVSEAMAIIDPSALWTATSDVSVALSLQTFVVAAHLAPKRFTDHTVRAAAPVVSPIGVVLVVGALLSLPVAIGLMELEEYSHSPAADFGIAIVLTLMALRVAWRIREDGRVTEDLVRSEEDFRGLIESSTDGIAIMDQDYRLLFTSPAARTLLGVRSGADDVALLDLVAPEDRARVRAVTEEHPAGDGTPLHLSVARENGTARELEITSSEQPGSGRRVLYLRDVTTRARRERELERMAYTDHLTALPNRAMLFQEMAAPSDAPRSLLVLDLDGFKAVNDVAGHESGDQLLVEVARRLNTVVRDDDLVARLGGDEFAVLVTGSIPEAEEVAQRVVDVMALPHRAGEFTFAVGASVGVAGLGAAGLGAAGGQAAFRDADAALRTAKQAGKGCVRVADVKVTESLSIEGTDLRTIVAEGTLALRMDAACGPDGRIEIVHASPFWKHPVYGVVRAQEMWATAARQGRVAELQRWLVREACATAAALPHDGIGVAVSLPSGHLSTDGLARVVASALADSGLAPSRLTLSFTEETLLTSSAALVPELEAVRQTGVRLCLDNYGMGQSLFALLARVSVDVVRVDLATLATRDDTARAMQVLASIARSTADFGLTAIAGGISTPELRDAAVAAGVQLVNGRALPHDLSVEALAELLIRPVPVG